MESKKIAIEFYSNMATNQIEDCKQFGDIVIIGYEEGLKLIAILIQEHVEFAVSEVGECFMDMSYEYWNQ